MPARPLLYRPEQKREFQSLYGDPAKTLDDIAEHFNVSRSTVKNTVNRLGLSKRGKGFTHPVRLIRNQQSLSS
jgi:DNA-binding MarR family transcriptional regulator